MSKPSKPAVRRVRPCKTCAVLFKAISRANDLGGVFTMELRNIAIHGVERSGPRRAGKGGR